jgi:hypothetical protein
MIKRIFEAKTCLSEAGVLKGSHQLVAQEDGLSVEALGFYPHLITWGETYHAKFAIPATGDFGVIEVVFSPNPDEESGWDYETGEVVEFLSPSPPDDQMMAYPAMTPTIISESDITPTWWSYGIAHPFQAIQIGAGVYSYTTPAGEYEVVFSGGAAFLGAFTTEQDEFVSPPLEFVRCLAPDPTIWEEERGQITRREYQSAESSSDGYRSYSEGYANVTREGVYRWKHRKAGIAVYPNGQIFNL